jgi:hypothetical protein
MKFRKKPVVIDAVQLTWSNWNDVCELTGPFSDGMVGCYVGADGKETEDTNGRIGLKIPTLEGTMLAVQDDWIIKGVKGEFYPCKPDVFAATYEPADGPIIIDNYHNGPAIQIISE